MKSNAKMMKREVTRLVHRTITSHNNFLSAAGKTVANKKGQALEFRIPKGFRFCEVFLLSDSNALKKNYNIPAAG